MNNSHRKKRRKARTVDPDALAESVQLDAEAASALPFDAFLETSPYKNMLTRMRERGQDEQTIREVGQKMLEIRALTDADVVVIDEMMSKYRRNDDDWDMIQDTLEGKSFFTIMPVDNRARRIYTEDNIFVHKGTFITFATQDDGLDFFKENYRQLGTTVGLTNVYFSDLIDTSQSCRMNCLIAYRSDPNTMFQIMYTPADNRIISIADNRHPELVQRLLEERFMRGNRH